MGKLKGKFECCSITNLLTNPSAGLFFWCAGRRGMYMAEIILDPAEWDIIR
jgi:hypothetical protein